MKLKIFILTEAIPVASWGNQYKRL